MRRLAIPVLLAFALSACGGGGSSAPPMNASTAAPAQLPSTANTAYTCPTSATTAGASSATAATHRLARTVPAASARSSNGLIAVLYKTASGATATRVVNVAPAQLAAKIAQLRAQSGVVAAHAVQYRYPLTASAVLTNDPFFRGEAGAVAPLYQNDSTDGQWDLHIMGVQNAYAYTLGSASVKLAVIDTGVDVTHPDLAGSRIVRTKCFLTSPGGVSSSGTIITDEDGHGTDVTGIAAAGTNNGFGFAGTGGNASLMLYRVFPTPDDNCTSDSSSDSQCGAADVDVASAIDDAVANGANVINLSLGGGECSDGQDSDTVEGDAVANAISHHVIVVAATGNAGGEGVDAPACDPGVIAVGASAYNDGEPNASNYTGPNEEYVATSYSQYGATNAAGSTTSWGLVAPGGDATGSSDDHYLHWIENIWTSTPFDSNFAGQCSVDVFGERNDCRTFIDGTSMAAAHVSGAAALVLSVSGTSGPYAAPSAMFQLLCTTADDIGDPHQGCGRLNVYRAVAKVAGS